jgi:phage-related protein (TIGR01555 family)
VAVKREAKKSPAVAFDDRILAASRRVDLKHYNRLPPSHLAFSVPAPGVIPDHAKPRLKLAMDEWNSGVGQWGGGQLAGMSWFGSSITFLGYPYLSELMQRPEYRHIVGTIATEMSREWIEFETKGDDDKTDKIQELEEELRRLQVRECFKQCAEIDGSFGRAHLYIDTGSTTDPEELKKPIGSGNDKLTKSKLGKGSLQRLKPIEPIWVYPAQYDSSDPLVPEWYNPQSWYVMGKEVHSSRLLRFVARPVPDMLKPIYMFGGLALTQLAMPYVDNWLRTRQSVSDLISAFSHFVLMTDMNARIQLGADEMDKRAEVFNNLRDNRGLFMLDKEKEDFKNVSASLAGLDALQAQSQEQMASVSTIPVVKLLGIQPAGLNASSQGELETFYTNIKAAQENQWRRPLETIVAMAQINLWGDVDQDITFKFKPLWSLNAKDIAELNKNEAERAQTYIDSGVISPLEERQRLASDPESGYNSIDVDDVPDLLEEEEAGLEPQGGRPSPVAGKGAGGEIAEAQAEEEPEQGKHKVDRDEAA